MTKLLLILCILSSSFAHAKKEPFSKVTKLLKNHGELELISQSADEMKATSELKSSWGDPKLKLAAKNYPKESLKNDEIGMTGVELGLTQRIPLTTKYGNIEKSYLEKGKAKLKEKDYRYNLLLKDLWFYLIKERSLKEEVSILKENLKWYKKTLKVSKKLYANGKISQQSLLDLKIRDAETQAALESTLFKIQEEKAKLKNLTHLDLNHITSIPWKILRFQSHFKEDSMTSALKHTESAQALGLKAKKLAYIPDIDVSVAYTKRYIDDGIGDFVSASVSFPLPFSDVKSSDKVIASKKLAAAKLRSRNYDFARRSLYDQFKQRYQGVTSELRILESRTLNYAQSARKVTSKSYALGGASYTELMQAQLKYQTLLLRKTKLKEDKLKLEVQSLFLSGGKLHE